MKIIVLGGAGDMGSRAVEDLASTQGVKRVTIADRNQTVAVEIAGRLSNGPSKVDHVAVDANDHASLVSAMKGYNVAASALGPFHLFEAKLVRAALDAGVDYCSICDEWDAAEAVFDRYDQEARRRGRFILTGLGASPGLSNVGVRYLGRSMDKIRRVDIYVYQPLDAGGGEAVLRHMLFIMTGKTAVWRGGKRVMIPACSEEREVEFPQFGKIRLWNMGHSEPVTIPRFMPGIDEVNFFMGYGRGSAFFVQPARLGLFKYKAITDRFVRLLIALEKLNKGKEPGHGAVRMDVWGSRKGKSVHKLLCGVGQMREATGLSLSVGALMLGRKELLTRKGGAYAPEGCIDPAKFIRRMKAKGHQAYEDVAMTRPIG